MLTWGFSQRQSQILISYAFESERENLCIFLDILGLYINLIWIPFYFVTYPSPSGERQVTRTSCKDFYFFVCGCKVALAYHTTASIRSFYPYYVSRWSVLVYWSSSELYLRALSYHIILLAYYYTGLLTLHHPCNHQFPLIFYNFLGIKILSLVVTNRWSCDNCKTETQGTIGKPGARVNDNLFHCMVSTACANVYVTKGGICI